MSRTSVMSNTLTENHGFRALIPQTLLCYPSSKLSPKDGFSLAGFSSKLSLGPQRGLALTTIDSKDLPKRATSMKSKRLSIRELLKPHFAKLTLGLLAVIGEGVANLLCDGFITSSGPTSSRC